MPKRTYQPSKIKKARTFGFMKRRKGKVLAKRRIKGRKKLIP